MALTGRMAYISEPLNYYRFHDNSVSGKDTLHLAETEETLHIVRWMQEQVSLTDSMRTKVGERLEGRWINPVLNAHVPLERKCAILRDAMAIDPQALHRLVRAAFRLHVWHPVLHLTRPVRHALGLRPENVKPSLKK